MAIDRCECCLGRKKIVALGGIVKDCINCKGVGYVASQALDSAVTTPVVRVKRARKPRALDVPPAPFVGIIPVNVIQSAVDSVANIGAISE